MSKELKFSDIKDELTFLVDGTIKKVLDNKDYDKKNVQSWANFISKENIKSVNQKQRNANHNLNSK